MKQHQTYRYNLPTFKDRIAPSTTPLEKGTLVLIKTEYLLPANLREMKSKKLLPRYVGPYPIEEVITPNVYRIGFPPSILVHDKVNKKNLKPYLSSTSTAPLDHLPSFLSKEIKLERQENIETIVDYN